MAKSGVFRTIPLSGGSKSADETDIKVIEENLLRFNRPGQRPCLVCDEEFHTEGAHNRHCKKCRAKYGEELWTARSYHNRRGADRRDCDRRRGYDI